MIHIRNELYVHIIIYLNSVIKCYDMNHRMDHLESLIMQKVKKNLINSLFYANVDVLRKKKVRLEN